MERLVRFIEDRPLIAVPALGAAAFCTLKVLKYTFNSLFGNSTSQLDKSQNKDGIIYLHLFPRSICRQHLNMSPFAIKLESWMRLKKIPYKTIETVTKSSKTGQIPYIILDGEEIADSNKIINFLEKKFNISENEGLNEEQQAISHCLLRTVDESLSWTYFTLRYMHYDHYYEQFFQLPLPNFFRKMAQRHLRKQITNRMILHGIGRKSIPEIAEIAWKDILAISKYLGDKKFLFGDSITKADCAVFAHLSQFVYVTLEYPHKEAMVGCPNILPYMERIKKQVWPDWDELVNMELFE